MDKSDEELQKLPDGLPPPAIGGSMQIGPRHYDFAPEPMTQAEMAEVEAADISYLAGGDALDEEP